MEAVFSNVSESEHQAILDIKVYNLKNKHLCI